jgi:hypothetical protein
VLPQTLKNIISFHNNSPRLRVCALSQSRIASVLSLDASNPIAIRRTLIGSRAPPLQFAYK